MNKKILKFRKEIDKIDSQIIKLIKKRIVVSKKLINFKKKNGLKVYDKKRESEIINKISKKSKLNNNFIKKIYIMIFKEVRGEIR